MDSDHTQSQVVLARELLPVAHNRDDRLPPMLFIATLFYALIILGISFDVGILPEPSDITSLEVTIVAENTRTARPDDADYLAQANQQGNGNTREQVAPGAAPTAPGQVAMPIERVGEVQLKANPGSDEARALLTTDRASDTRIFKPDEISEQPAETARVAQALPSGMQNTLPLPEDDNPSLLITDDNPRHLVVSVNSAQSDIAPYLNSWKRRVERIGTLNFPSGLKIDGLTGSPTLQVAITPDGRLSEVLVLRSSGYTALDQAAMMVLNRASPFAAFPADIRERYDLLRFAYKFEFRGERMRGTVSVSGNDG